MARTPLYDAHVAAGGRIVDFHGWDMPVQYAGILEETRRVRGRAGLFDLCHKDREALVEHVFSANLGKMKYGKAKYGFLLDERGFPLDDVLVYRDRDLVHVVINATGRGKDPDWVRARQKAKGFQADVKDVSEEQAMIALQGPASEAILQPLVGYDLSSIPYYGFANGPVLGIPALIARTGYTGEDGFELFFPKAHARKVWDAVLATGKSMEIEPIGLGARDTLRLEAGMPLYGQEIGPEIHPLEADLAFGLDLTKKETVGIPPLAALKTKGFPRRAVSLVGQAGRVARTDTRLFHQGADVGVVTSGSFSPTLDKSIARGLVGEKAAAVGTTLEAEIRGKRYPMTVVKAPFYQRAR
jgi:glycine cleavage system T protein (aminomethyltransferase)